MPVARSHAAHDPTKRSGSAPFLKGPAYLSRLVCTRCSLKDGHPCHEQYQSIKSHSVRTPSSRTTRPRSRSHQAGIGQWHQNTLPTVLSLRNNYVCRAPYCSTRTNGPPLASDDDSPCTHSEPCPRTLHHPSIPIQVGQPKHPQRKFQSMPTIVCPISSHWERPQ